MFLKREYILGYLRLLDHEPVLKQLSADDLEVGRKYVNYGCVAYLMNFLDNQKTLRVIEMRRVLEVIKYREVLTSFLDAKHPQLQRASAECAEVVHELLVSEDRFAMVQGEFSAELDEEIEKLMSGYGTAEKDFLADFDKNFKIAVKGV